MSVKRLPCLDCDNDGRVCECLTYERYKKALDDVKTIGGEKQ